MSNRRQSLACQSGTGAFITEDASNSRCATHSGIPADTLGRHSRLAIAAVGNLLLAGSARAQSRSRTTTVQSVQQRYGIQDAYDGTMLHPDGRRSTAVPITMDDGRTGEFVIPSGKQDPNAVYYRDDQTGELRPVRMDGHMTRKEFVQAPRAVRYQPETQPHDKQSWGWAQDALVVGGGAGGGALIGAAAGGKKRRRRWRGRGRRWRIDL
jgi:hypothetical protein